MDAVKDRAGHAWNQLRDLFNSHRYQVLRQKDELLSPPSPSSQKSTLRLRYLPRWSIKYLLIFACAVLIGIALITRNLIYSRPTKTPQKPMPPEFVWQNFPLEIGYSDGLRNLVSSTPEAIGSEQGDSQDETSRKYPEPFEYSPYRSDPLSDLPPAEACFLDDGNKIPAPAVWAYDGVPQQAPEPMLGSHDAVDLNKDVCFDRYGRYAGYGFGYEAEQGGTGFGIHGDMESTDLSLRNQSRIDWRKIDLGRAQTLCTQRNRHRFKMPSPADGTFHHTQDWPTPSESLPSDNSTENEIRKHVERTAVVLRLWDQYQWTDWSHLYLRSLISELNLKSGAEYDIHLLVQVKDNSPIWASEEVYQEVLDRAIPPEYRSLTTLWSEDLMRLLYPGPFEPQFNRPGPIHGVGRSIHMALQWFGVHHPEYDFFWNWEMDIRYVGHWYELFDRVGKRAENQPRRGMWERAGRFYIPSAHGEWDAFVEDTEVRAVHEGEPLIHGPQTFAGWEESDRRDRLGENYLDKFDLPPPIPPSEAEPTSSDSYDSLPSNERHLDPADLITFLPQFQPERTFWIFRADVSGYSTDIPIPPRRASIVTASRMSLRLLRIMHAETARGRHSMGGEMFPSSMALHHGLKSVFAPHPMYFNRRWNSSEYIEHVFNSDEATGASGGNSESVFSEIPQHNFRGGSYYYDSGFAGRLWRRWLGFRERDGGGEREELEGSGRMCLRSVLLHPIKWEDGDVG